MEHNNTNDEGGAKAPSPGSTSTNAKTRIFQPADPSNFKLTSTKYPNWIEEVRALELQWNQGIENMFAKQNNNITPPQSHARTPTPPSTSKHQRKTNVSAQKLISPSQSTTTLQTASGFVPPKPHPNSTNLAQDSLCTNSVRDTASSNSKRKATKSPLRLHVPYYQETVTSSSSEPRSDVDVEDVTAVSSQSQCNGVEQMYAVLIAKQTTKKHRTWQNDGILIVKPGNDITLVDEDNRILFCASNYKFPLSGLIPGETELSLGEKMVQIQYLM